MPCVVRGVVHIYTALHDFPFGDTDSGYTWSEDEKFAHGESSKSSGKFHLGATFAWKGMCLEWKKKVMEEWKKSDGEVGRMGKGEGLKKGSTYIQSLELSSRLFSFLVWVSSRINIQPLVTRSCCFRKRPDQKSAKWQPRFEFLPWIERILKQNGQNTKKKSLKSIAP